MFTSETVTVPRRNVLYLTDEGFVYAAAGPMAPEARAAIGRQLADRTPGAPMILDDADFVDMRSRVGDDPGPIELGTYGPDWTFWFALCAPVALVLAILSLLFH